MIFVTVGTHEQQFNRLIKKIDDLKAEGKIKEDVLIQTGFSTYEPKHCEWKSMLSAEEMDRAYKDARIIIAHGGTGTYISVIGCKKVPIIVPRDPKYDEHINNHQLNFCRKVADVQKNIILVEDVQKLESTIKDYDKIVSNMKVSDVTNNEKFCSQLSREMGKLFSESE